MVPVVEQFCKELTAKQLTSLVPPPERSGFLIEKTAMSHLSTRLLKRSTSYSFVSLDAARRRRQ